MAFFDTPPPLMSHFVIFFPNPLSLCDSLKSDKSWLEKDGFFVNMAAKGYDITYKEAENVGNYILNLCAH